MPQNNPAPSGYALFDLDQTLVPWDMQLLFGNWIFHKYPWRRVYLLFFLCALPAFKLIGARRMKRLFMTFLHGLSANEVARVAQEFVDHYHPDLFYPEIVELYEQQKAAGHLTILTSASPSLYVHLIGQKLGFDHTFCTEVTPCETFPFLPGIPQNNKGSIKTTRLHYWLREQGIQHNFPLPNSTAYTDSTADLPLVGCSEQTVLVHPSDKLKQAVEQDYQKPYQVFLPTRPFQGDFAHLLVSLKKMFGFYPIS